jgi:hypothetical protein
MRGSKPGERRGGRRRGTKNKRTVERERAVAEAATKIAGALGPDAFEGDALSLMQLTYRDEKQPLPIRLSAAQAAIQFERPRLTAMKAEVTGKLTLAELVQLSFSEDLPALPEPKVIEHEEE